MTPDKKERVKLTKQKSKERAKEFLYEYLSARSCADCGERDVTILTFDHVLGEKKNDIANLARGGYSLETLKAEIEKTEVVCFNCHMRREQSRRGYDRFGRFDS